MDVLGPRYTVLDYFSRLFELARDLPVVPRAMRVLWLRKFFWLVFTGDPTYDLCCRHEDSHDRSTALYWLCGTGWWHFGRAVVLPAETAVSATSSPQQFGVSGPYSSIFWPGSLLPGEVVDDFLEVWTAGRGGSLATVACKILLALLDHQLIIIWNSGCPLIDSI